jgi:tRNA 5-methylaminomethyl-2-thiouridine biosynthesis bifunctional protein
VIRIPKDAEDAKKFSEYEKHNENRYEIYTKDTLQNLGIDTEFESFFFPEAGDCDAREVCALLLRDIDVVQYEVQELTRQDDIWIVGEYRAKNIVLATGYESDLSDLRYMGIKGTWGTRGDFSSKLDLKVSMHQSMSVGANVGGIIKLGATHEKQVKEPVACSEEQALSLKEKASSLVDTTGMTLEKVYCGMRAGSHDYFPLVGKVIDVRYMLENYPNVVRGAKPALQHIDGLYILNGLGGRGFVFAPLMAKMLAESIISEEEVDSRVNPDRLFLKWARKQN